MSEDQSTRVDDFFCPQCEYEGTEVQVQGHIGAKHVRKLKPIKHGTVAGYKAEKRRGFKPCVACLVAWRRYYQAYRANRRLAADRLKRGLPR